MHELWITPLYPKGKMQGKLGDAPDSVIQTGFLELSSLVDSAIVSRPVVRATLDSKKNTTTWIGHKIFYVTFGFILGPVAHSQN